MKHLAFVALAACATTAGDDTATDDQDSNLAPSAATRVLADAVHGALDAGTPQPTPAGTLLHSCRTLGVTPAIRFQVWAHSATPPVDDYGAGEMVLSTGGSRVVVPAQIALGRWSSSTYLNDDTLFVVHRFHFSLTVNDGEGYALFNRGLPIQEGKEQVSVRCTPAPDGWGA
jgi:hypothetical protein